MTVDKRFVVDGHVAVVAVDRTGNLNGCVVAGGGRDVDRMTSQDTVNVDIQGVEQDRVVGGDVRAVRNSDLGT